MSNVRFLWDNRRFDQARLTASSEKSTLPAANLQNVLRGKPWRTDGTGQAHLDIDFNGPVTLNALAVIEHDLFSGAALTLRAYDDAHVTESFSRTFQMYESIVGWGLDTWGATNFGGLPDASVLDSLPRITHVFHFDDVTVNARYWRLEIDNAETEFSIGRIFLTDHWEPAVNFPYGWTMSLQDASLTETSLGGQKWTDLRQQYYRLAFNLDHLDEPEAFGTLLRIVKHAGLRRDIVLSLSDRDGYLKYYTALYGRFTRIPDLGNPSFGRYACALEFEESL